MLMLLAQSLISDTNLILLNAMSFQIHTVYRMFFSLHALRGGGHITNSCPPSRCVVSTFLDLLPFPPFSAANACLFQISFHNIHPPHVWSSSFYHPLLFTILALSICPHTFNVFFYLPPFPCVSSFQYLTLILSSSFL